MSHIFRRFISCILQGTFWYHSHFQNQYCDGLRGALVVYDPEDPHLEKYDIDDGEREVKGQYVLYSRTLRRDYRHHARGLVNSLTNVRRDLLTRSPTNVGTIISPQTHPVSREHIFIIFMAYH